MNQRRNRYRKIVPAGVQKLNINPTIETQTTNTIPLLISLRAAIFVHCSRSASLTSSKQETVCELSVFVHTVKQMVVKSPKHFNFISHSLPGEALNLCVCFIFKEQPLTATRTQ